jgi:beta-glucosidase
MPLNYYTPHKTINARDPASKPILMKGAMEGHVLVKNVKNALPLKKPKMISIFGYDAAAPPANNVPSASQSFGAWSLGTESLLNYAVFFSTDPVPQIAINGTIISGGERALLFLS